MCDVKRQLSKLHVTVRLPAGVSPSRKLVEKAFGLVATDANTPVLGELARVAVERSELKNTAPIPGIRSWWAKFEESEQFPNANVNGWMDAEFLAQFPEFDRKIFGDWIGSTRSLDDLLDAPLCAEPKPASPAAVPAVVDGDALPAKEASTGSVPAEQAAPPSEEPKEQGAAPRGRSKQRERKIESRAPGPSTSARKSDPGPKRARSPAKTAPLVQPELKRKPQKWVAKVRADQN
jgi:hypothetical protein